MFFFLTLDLKRDLFRHLYLEEEFLDELSAELEFSCNYALELFLNANFFSAIESQLFKILTAGKKVEVVLFMDGNQKSISLTHAIFRIISQGGQVYSLKADKSEYPNFAVVDKSYLISENFELVEDTSERLVYLARQKFKSFKKSSEAFEFKPQKIDLIFFAEREFVRKGEEVLFHWEAKHADYVIIEPYPGLVESKGRFPFKLEEDTLVKVTAVNSLEKITKSLFIKVIPGNQVEFQVSVYEEDIEGFIPIESPVEFPGSFAVNSGQKVRIRWNAGSHGRLFSTQWGQLKLVDKIETEIFVDTQFDFEYRDVFHQMHQTIRFFTIEKYGDIENKSEIALKSALWRTIISMFIKRV